MAEIGLADFEQADIASATTTDIGVTPEWKLRITGTTTITGFGTAANRIRFLVFAGILTLTHHATSLILPTGANITTAAGDTAIVMSDGSGNWRVVSYTRANGKALTPPGAPTIQIFTSSGTWNKPAGITAAIVELVGGGGGSGGSALTTASQVSVARGGGAGGYSRKRIAAASLGSTETVTIGAGGTAGTAGNNAGGAGGTTSFGSHLQATGGAAGGGGAAGTMASGEGAAGGVGSLGDVNTAGMPSSAGSGFFNTVQMIVASNGGSSHFGGGGLGRVGAVGQAGQNYGSGAGGSSCAASTVADKAGAAGSAGLIIVTEYYD